MASTPTARLDTIDLARAIAVLGMFVAHTFSHYYPDNRWTAIFDGRASVLFAILAGMSVEFLTRKRRPGTDASLIIRGIVLALIGLSLSSLPVGPMVILTTYGALYVLVAPIAYRMSTRALAVASVVGAVAFPLLNWSLREQLIPVGEFGDTPTWEILLDGQYLRAFELLFFNGLFPVITWIPFFLAGLVVARLLLAGTRWLRTVLIVGGIALGALGLYVSHYVLDVKGFRQWYAGFHPDGWLATDYLVDNAFGTPVGDNFHWLFVYVPHSGSFTEIFSSAGFALATIGLCTLLPKPATRLLQPIVRLGRMPLTAYTAHIVAIGVAAMNGYDITQPVAAWANLLIPIAFAWVWFRYFKRGPLESALTKVASLPGSA